MDARDKRCIINKGDRVLYLRLSAIGDVVNAIPGFVAFRRRYPDNYVAWCVEEKAADILRGHPLIDELIVIKSVWRYRWYDPRIMGQMIRFVRSLRLKAFDVTIDVHNIPKSLIVAWLSGAKVRIGSTRKGEGFLLTHNFRQVEPQGPAAVRRAAYLEKLGVDVSHLEYLLPPLEGHLETVNRVLEQEGVLERRPVVVLNPRASRPAKEWPGSHFIALATKIIQEFDAQILWTGSAEDRPFIQSLVDAIPFRTWNMAGKFELKELATLLGRVNLMVTGDTGPMHIGAAVGTFVIALMGPTAPEHGPFSEKKVIISKRLPCQYCGGKKCKKPECMSQITPDEVFEQVCVVLKRQ